MKKKCIVFLLVMTIVSIFAIPALAEDMWEVNYDGTIISPMFTYISTAYADVFINSSGKATAETYVAGNSAVTSAKATINLQQYKGGRWTTIKTWNESSNSRILDFIGTHYVSSGYEYRVQSNVTVNSGSRTESTTVTSSSQGY